MAVIGHEAGMLPICSVDVRGEGVCNEPKERLQLHLRREASNQGPYS